MEQVKPEEKKEVKAIEGKDNVDGTIKKIEMRKTNKPAAGPKQEGSVDDLWLKQETGKEALRPGGRSKSLKVQRSTSSVSNSAETLVSGAGTVKHAVKKA